MNTFYPRSTAELLLHSLRGYPVVVLTGPRQSGKSTLLRQALPGWQMVSLEDIDLREFAQSDPRAFFQRYPAPLILDEAQRVPDLLSSIQTMVDASGRMRQYVLSGSQQFSLLAGVTQSLAGRASLIRTLIGPWGEDGVQTTVLQCRTKEASYANHPHRSTFRKRDPRSRYAVRL
jgi:predicted AAA+ superfamily ATPase